MSFLVDNNQSEIRKWRILAKTYNADIDLTLGEPNYFSPRKVKSKIKKALFKNKTYYANTDGIKELKNKILKEKNIFNYKYDELLITNGATEGIYLSLSALLNKDDEVIIFKPYYPNYLNVSNYLKIKYKLINTEDDNYQLNDNLKNKITKNTKAIILNTPQNPTGSILNEKSLSILKEIIKDHPEIHLIFDLVYQDIIYNKKNNIKILPDNYIDIKNNLILIYSFSKTYAMMGYRIGYLFSNKSLVSKMKYLHGLINSSTNTFVQYSCLEALNYNYHKNIKKLNENLNYSIQKLKELNVDFHIPDGALYIYINTKKYNLTGDNFCFQLLKKYKVALVSGSAFGDIFKARLCFTKKREILKEAFKRINQYLIDNNFI